MVCEGKQCPRFLMVPYHQPIYHGPMLGSCLSEGRNNLDCMTYLGLIVNLWVEVQQKKPIVVNIINHRSQ